MVPLIHASGTEELAPQPLRIEEPLSCDLRIRGRQLLARPFGHVIQHGDCVSIAAPPAEHLGGILFQVFVLADTEEIEEFVLEVADVVFVVGRSRRRGVSQGAEEEGRAEGSEG